MTKINTLFAKNRSWASLRSQRNPEYFLQNIHSQQPHSLWIGCSDSRVPAEILINANPGELFVHRNIANMVLENDDNFMSVLQYALEYLKVSHIILCGHYGCGGVQAASELSGLSLNNEDSPLSRRIYQLRKTISPALSKSIDVDESERLNTLVEANVLAQFESLIATRLVQQVWQSGVELDVLGCVYDLKNGQLKELVIRNKQD